MMDFSALVADLRDVAEKYKGKTSEPQVSTVVYVDMFTKILQRAERIITKYEDQIMMLWVALNQLATLYKDLAAGSARDQLTRFIFGMCARTVLNIQWPQLDEDNSVKQNFCKTVENVHEILTGLGFNRFQLILDLMENHWTHPTLTQIMSGDDEDEIEDGLEYIQNQDPEILKLRIEIMMKENCEEFALNLCTWSLKHQALKNDLKIKEHQIVIMYKQSMFEKMQEVCESILCHDGIKVMAHLTKNQANQSLCIRLAQIFLVQDWIKPERNCCTQELLKLWIHHQYLDDKDEERFLESIWAVAKVSRSTEQIGVLIDGVRKECGDTFIQLYTELCKYAINIDKGNMDKELEKENLQAVKERQFAIAKTCVRMAYMLKEYDFRIAKICGLTAFALDTTFDSLNLVNRLYWTVKFTAATSSESKVNPATLYEIERLLEPLRPNLLDPEFTWKKIIPLCKKYKTERDVLLKESCQYVPVLKDPKQSLKYFKKGSSSNSANLSQKASTSGTETNVQNKQEELKKPTAVDIDRLLGQQFPRGVGKNMEDFSMKDLDKTINDLKKSINEETEYRKMLQAAGFSSKGEKKQKSPGAAKDPSVKKERVKKEPKQVQQTVPRSTASNVKTVIPQTSNKLSNEAQKPLSLYLGQSHYQPYQGVDKMPPPAAHRNSPGPFSPPISHQSSPGFRSPPVAHSNHPPSSPRDLISPQSSGSNLSQYYRQISSSAQFSPSYTPGSVNQKTSLSSSPLSRPPSVSHTASDALKQSLSTKIHSEMLRKNQNLSGSVSQLNIISPPSSKLQRQHSVPNLPSSVSNERRSYTIEYSTTASSSPAECARIAQQIAQMHLKQRAEREKLEGKKPRKPRQKKVQDVPKASLTSKSVFSKSQISEMLNQTMKGSAETNSERVQNIVHIRNQILQAESANRLTTEVKQTNPNIQQMGNTGNANMSNTAYLNTQTARSESLSSSIIGPSDQIDVRSQNQKFYLTSTSVIDKLKKDKTGGVNLSESTGLSVKPVFSMIVPRALTTPDNQEELVRRVTNMVKKATSSKESSGSSLASAVSSTSHVQSTVRQTSSNVNIPKQKTIEEIKSTPVPDHVLEFLKTKSKGEQRPQKIEPNRMVVRSVSMTTQDQNRSKNTLQSSAASARTATVTSRQQVQSSGFVPVTQSANTNMGVVANTIAGVNKSSVSQLTALTGVVLPHSQSSLNVLANVASNSTALPGRQQQNQIPVTFGNQNQASTISAVPNTAMTTHQPTQNLLQPNIPRQNIVPQAALQQTMNFTTQPSTEARIRLPVTSEQSEQRFIHVFDQFGNKQIVNMTPQTHLMQSDSDSMVIGQMSPNTQMQQSVGDAQKNFSQHSPSNSGVLQHIAPSTVSINNFIPLQPIIPAVASDPTVTLQTQLQPESLTVSNTGAPIIPQMGTSTTTEGTAAPRQQFNIVPELSPAVVQQILTDLMKTGSQQPQQDLSNPVQRTSTISPPAQTQPQQHKREIYIFPKSVADRAVDGTMQIVNDSSTSSISKTVEDHAKQILSGQVNTNEMKVVSGSSMLGQSLSQNFQAHSVQNFTGISTQSSYQPSSVLSSRGSDLKQYNQSVQNTTSGQFYSPSYMTSSGVLSPSQVANVSSSVMQPNTIPITLSQTPISNQLLQVPDLPDLGSKEFGIDEILRTDSNVDQNNQRSESAENQSQKQTVVNKSNKLNVSQKLAVSRTETDKTVLQQASGSSSTNLGEDVIQINSDQDMLRHVESLLSGKTNVTLAKQSGQIVKQEWKSEQQNMKPADKASVSNVQNKVKSGPVNNQNQENTLEQKPTVNPLASVEPANMRHGQVESKVSPGKSTFFNAARLAKEREEREMKLKLEKPMLKKTEDRLSVKICGICSQTFDTVEKLKEHVKFNLCPSKQCKLCERMFPSLEELRNHLKVPCKGPKTKQLKDFEYTKIFVCSKCNFTSQNEKIGTKHVENCNVSSSPVKAKVTIWFKCHMCREVLHDKDLAYKHISRFCPQLKAAKAQQEVQYAMDKLKSRTDKVVVFPRKPDTSYKDPKSFIQDCFLPENSRVQDIKHEMQDTQKETSKIDKRLLGNKKSETKGFSMDNLLHENVKVESNKPETKIETEEIIVNPMDQSEQTISQPESIKQSSHDSDKTEGPEDTNKTIGCSDSASNVKDLNDSFDSVHKSADKLKEVDTDRMKDDENMKKLTDSILAETKKTVSNDLKKDTENKHKTENESMESEKSKNSESPTSRSEDEKQKLRSSRKQITKRSPEKYDKKQVLSPKTGKSPESDLKDSQSTCKLCLYSSANGRSLARHYTQAHDFGFKLQNKRYRCKYCDVSFQSSSKVKIKGHLMKHFEILLKQIAKCKHLNRNHPHLTPEKNEKVFGNAEFSPRRMKKHIKARAARSKCAENLKRLSYEHKAGVSDENAPDNESEERRSRSVSPARIETKKLGRPRKYPVGQEPYLVNRSYEHKAGVSDENAPDNESEETRSRSVSPTRIETKKLGRPRKYPVGQEPYLVNRSLYMKPYMKKKKVPNAPADREKESQEGAREEQSERKTRQSRLERSRSNSVNSSVSVSENVPDTRRSSLKTNLRSGKETSRISTRSNPDKDKIETVSEKKKLKVELDDGKKKEITKTKGNRKEIDTRRPRLRGSVNVSSDAETSESDAEPGTPMKARLRKRKLDEIEVDDTALGLTKSSSTSKIRRFDAGNETEQKPDADICDVENANEKEESIKSETAGNKRKKTGTDKQDILEMNDVDNDNLVRRSLRPRSQAMEVISDNENNDEEEGLSCTKKSLRSRRNQNVDLERESESVEKRRSSKRAKGVIEHSESDADDDSSDHDTDVVPLRKRLRRRSGANDRKLHDSIQREQNTEGQKDNHIKNLKEVTSDSEGSDDEFKDDRPRSSSRASKAERKASKRSTRKSINKSKNTKGSVLQINSDSASSMSENEGRATPVKERLRERKSLNTSVKETPDLEDVKDMKSSQVADSASSMSENEGRATPVKERLRERKSLNASVKETPDMDTTDMKSNKAAKKTEKASFDRDRGKPLNRQKRKDGIFDGDVQASIDVIFNAVEEEYDTLTTNKLHENNESDKDYIEVISESSSEENGSSRRSQRKSKPKKKPIKSKAKKNKMTKAEKKSERTCDDKSEISQEPDVSNESKSFTVMLDPAKEFVCTVEMPIDDKEADSQQQKSKDTATNETIKAVSQASVIPDDDEFSFVKSCDVPISDKKKVIEESSKDNMKAVIIEDDEFSFVSTTGAALNAKIAHEPERMESHNKKPTDNFGTEFLKFAQKRFNFSTALNASNLESKKMTDHQRKRRKSCSALQEVKVVPQRSSDPDQTVSKDEATTNQTNDRTSNFAAAFHAFASGSRQDLTPLSEGDEQKTKEKPAEQKQPTAKENIDKETPEKMQKKNEKLDDFPKSKEKAKIESQDSVKSPVTSPVIGMKKPGFEDAFQEFFKRKLPLKETKASTTKTKPATSMERKIPTKETTKDVSKRKSLEESMTECNVHVDRLTEKEINKYTSPKQSKMLPKQAVVMSDDSRQPKEESKRNVGRPHKEMPKEHDEIIILDSEDDSQEETSEVVILDSDDVLSSTEVEDLNAQSQNQSEIKEFDNTGGHSIERINCEPSEESNDEQEFAVQCDDQEKGQIVGDGQNVQDVETKIVTEVEKEKEAQRHDATNKILEHVVNRNAKGSLQTFECEVEKTESNLSALQTEEESRDHREIVIEPIQNEKDVSINEHTSSTTVDIQTEGQTVIETELSYKGTDAVKESDGQFDNVSKEEDLPVPEPDLPGDIEHKEASSSEGVQLDDATKKMAVNVTTQIHDKKDIGNPNVVLFENVMASVSLSGSSESIDLEGTIDRLAADKTEQSQEGKDMGCPNLVLIKELVNTYAEGSLHTFECEVEKTESNLNVLQTEEESADDQVIVIEPIQNEKEVSIDGRTTSTTVDKQTEGQTGIVTELSYKGTDTVKESDGQFDNVSKEEDLPVPEPDLAGDMEHKGAGSSEVVKKDFATKRVAVDITTENQDEKDIGSPNAVLIENKTACVSLSGSSEGVDLEDTMDRLAGDTSEQKQEGKDTGSPDLVLIKEVILSENEITSVSLSGSGDDDELVETTNRLAVDVTMQIQEEKHIGSPNSVLMKEVLPSENETASMSLSKTEVNIKAKDAEESLTNQEGCIAISSESTDIDGDINISKDIEDSSGFSTEKLCEEMQSDTDSKQPFVTTAVPSEHTALEKITANQIEIDGIVEDKKELIMTIKAKAEDKTQEVCQKMLHEDGGILVENLEMSGSKKENINLQNERENIFEDIGVSVEKENLISETNKSTGNYAKQEIQVITERKGVDNSECQVDEETSICASAEETPVTMKTLESEEENTPKVVTTEVCTFDVFSIAKTLELFPPDNQISQNEPDNDTDSTAVNDTVQTCEQALKITIALPDTPHAVDDSMNMEETTVVEENQNELEQNTQVCEVKHMHGLKEIGSTQNRDEKSSKDEPGFSYIINSPKSACEVVESVVFELDTDKIMAHEDLSSNEKKTNSNYQDDKLCEINDAANIELRTFETTAEKYLNPESVDERLDEVGKENVNKDAGVDMYHGTEQPNSQESFHLLPDNLTINGKQAEAMLIAEETAGYEAHLEDSIVESSNSDSKLMEDFGGAVSNNKAVSSEMNSSHTDKMQMDSEEPETPEKKEPIDISKEGQASISSPRLEKLVPYSDDESEEEICEPKANAIDVKDNQVSNTEHQQYKQGQETEAQVEVLENVQDSVESSDAMASVLDNKTEKSEARNEDLGTDHVELEENIRHSSDEGAPSSISEVNMELESDLNLKPSTEQKESVESVSIKSSVEKLESLTREMSSESNNQVNTKDVELETSDQENEAFENIPSNSILNTPRESILSREEQMAFAYLRSVWKEDEIDVVKLEKMEERKDDTDDDSEENTASSSEKETLSVHALSVEEESYNIDTSGKISDSNKVHGSSDSFIKEITVMKQNLESNFVENDAFAVDGESKKCLNETNTQSDTDETSSSVKFGIEGPATVNALDIAQQFENEPTVVSDEILAESENETSNDTSGIEMLPSTQHHKSVSPVKIDHSSEEWTLDRESADSHNSEEKDTTASQESVHAHEVTEKDTIALEMGSVALVQSTMQSVDTQQEAIEIHDDSINTESENDIEVYLQQTQETIQLSDTGEAKGNKLTKVMEFNETEIDSKNKAGMQEEPQKIIEVSAAESIDGHKHLTGLLPDEIEPYKPRESSKMHEQLPMVQGAQENVKMAADLDENLEAIREYDSALTESEILVQTVQESESPSTDCNDRSSDSSTINRDSYKEVNSVQITADTEFLQSGEFVAEKLNVQDDRLALAAIATLVENNQIPVVNGQYQLRGVETCPVIPAELRHISIDNVPQDAIMLDSTTGFLEPTADIRDGKALIEESLDTTGHKAKTVDEEEREVVSFHSENEDANSFNYENEPQANSTSSGVSMDEVTKQDALKEDIHQEAKTCASIPVEPAHISTGNTPRDKVIFNSTTDFVEPTTNIIGDGITLVEETLDMTGQASETNDEQDQKAGVHSYHNENEPQTSTSLDVAVDEVNKQDALNEEINQEAATCTVIPAEPADISIDNVHQGAVTLDSTTNFIEPTADTRDGKALIEEGLDTTGQKAKTVDEEERVDVSFHNENEDANSFNYENEPQANFTSLSVSVDEVAKPDALKEDINQEAKTCAIIPVEPAYFCTGNNSQDGVMLDSTTDFIESTADLREGKSLVETSLNTTGQAAETVDEQDQRENAESFPIEYDLQAYFTSSDVPLDELSKNDTVKEEINHEVKSEDTEQGAREENDATTYRTEFTASVVSVNEVAKQDALNEEISQEAKSCEIKQEAKTCALISVEPTISTSNILQDAVILDSTADFIEATADIRDGKASVEKNLDTNGHKAETVDEHDQREVVKQDTLTGEINQTKTEETNQNAREDSDATAYLTLHHAQEVTTDTTAVTLEDKTEIETDLQQLPEFAENLATNCDVISEQELADTALLSTTQVSAKHDNDSEVVLDTIPAEQEIAETSVLSTHQVSAKHAVDSEVVDKTLNLVNETFSSEIKQNMTAEQMQEETPVASVHRIPTARFYKSPPRETCEAKVIGTDSKIKNLTEGRHRTKTTEKLVSEKPVVKFTKKPAVVAVKQNVKAVQSKSPSMLKEESSRPKVKGSIEVVVKKESKTKSAGDSGTTSVSKEKKVSSEPVKTQNIRSKETQASQEIDDTKKMERRSSVKEIAVPVEEGDKEDLEEFTKRTESVKKSLRKSKGKGYECDFNLEDYDHDDGMSTCSSSSSGTSFSSHGLELDSLKVVPGPSHVVSGPSRAISPFLPAECSSPQKNTVSTMTTKIMSRKTYSNKSCVVSKVMAEKLKKYSKKPIQKLIVLRQPDLSKVSADVGPDKNILPSDGSDSEKRVSLPKIVTVIRQYSKFSLPLRDEPESPRSVSSESNSGSESVESGGSDTADQTPNPLKSFRRLHSEDVPFSWSMNEEETNFHNKGTDKSSNKSKSVIDVKGDKSTVLTVDKSIGQISGKGDPSVTYSIRRRSSQTETVSPQIVYVERKTKAVSGDKSEVIEGRRILRSPSVTKEPQDIATKTSNIQKELPGIRKINDSKTLPGVETKLSNVTKELSHVTRGAAKSNAVSSAVKSSTVSLDMSSKRVMDHESKKDKLTLSSKVKSFVQTSSVKQVKESHHVRPNTRKSIDSAKPIVPRKKEQEKDISLAKTRSLSMRHLLTQTGVMSQAHETLATDVDGSIIPDTAPLSTSKANSAKLSDLVRIESPKERSPPRGVKRKSGHVETETLGHVERGQNRVIEIAKSVTRSKDTDKHSQSESRVEMQQPFIDTVSEPIAKQPKLSEEVKSGHEANLSVKKSELNAQVIALEKDKTGVGKCTCQSSNSFCEDCKKRQKEQKPSGSKVIYMSCKPAVRHIVHDGKVIQIKKGSITETDIGSSGAVGCSQSPKSRDISPQPSERRSRLGSGSESPKKKKSRTSSVKSEGSVEMLETSLYVKTEADLNKYIHETLKEIRKDRQHHRPPEHFLRQPKQETEKDESKWKVTKTKDSYAFKRSRPVT